MNATQEPPPTVNVRLAWFSLATGIVLLATALAGSFALLSTRAGLRQQAELSFDKMSRATVKEVRNKLEPAARLLLEFQSQAVQGSLSVSNLDELGVLLVERLRFQRELSWLSYSEHSSGRFVGARRREDGAVILNRSDPNVDDGKPFEYLAEPDGSRKELPRDKPSGYDPREKAWYRQALAAEGRIAWTAPYRFNDGSPGITVALALQHPGKPAPSGVFTADFFLADLSAFLDTLEMPKDGYLYLLDRNASQIAAPLRQNREAAVESLAVALREFPQPLADLAAGNHTHFEVRGLHEPFLASTEAFEVLGGATWTVVALLPERVVLGESAARPSWIVLGLFAATLFLGVGSLVIFRRARTGKHPTGTLFGTTALSGVDSTAGGPPGLPEPLERVGRTQEIPPTEAVGSPVRGSAGPARRRFIFEQRSGAHDPAAETQAFELDRPIEDLIEEPLLAKAPHALIDDRKVPALAGIPLLAKLGQGAFGAVYYGIHPRLKRDVAVKVLSFLVAQKNEDWIKRFYREAQIAARVQSPNLIAVFDVDETRGLFYLVMEYIRGASGGELLRWRKHEGQAGLTEREALDICVAATAGLAAAHAQGIIHRDIKPDNILVPYAPRSDRPLYESAKLTDLGIARTEEKGHTMTETQIAMGTFGYMAPEQARDAKNSVKASDVFAMGCTLYDLLTGEPPFVGTSALNILMDTIEKPHLPIQTLRPDLSPATILVLDRCLEKDPRHRYPDGGVLLDALKAARANLKA
ncbi:MAG: hypothetical protein AMXMBFR7_14670 [Planctomycetota bacterium]